MNNDIMVSIIVPIYNVEKYLAECIDSLINQTYSNIEILLIDDGSPDNCGKICDEYAKNNDKIKVFHKKNGGLSDARNYGIDNSNGKYLMFVDSDDFVASNMVEELIDSIIANNCEIAICGRYLYSDGSVSEKHTLKEKKLYSTNEALKEILIGGEIEEATWDKIYKKDLFNDIRFPVGEINEDLVTIPMLIGKAKRISHVGKALYYYRYNSVGISKSGYNEKKNIIIPHLDTLGKYIKSNHPSLFKYFKICEYRYSYSVLLSLSMDSCSRKKFNNEYRIYKSMFKRNFMISMIYGKLSIKDKICSLLILLNLYNFIWKIKHKES